MKKYTIGILFVCLAAYGATQWGNLEVKGTLTNAGLPVLNQTNTVTGITSKTFTSPAINGANLNFGTASNTNRILLPNDNTTNLDALTDTAGLFAYDTTTSKPVYNNGSGWQQVGSGAGGTNEVAEYITEGKFESASTGWSAYADAASSSPADCTGGSPNVTIARTTTAGEILSGDASLEMVKGAANRQGEGFSYDFTIDDGMAATMSPVYLSFEYKATSNYASSDIKIFVYDKDATTLLGVQDISNLSGALLASTTKNKWSGVFYPTSASSDDYRLCVHVSSTSASAYDFHLDSVHAGKQIEVPGFMGSYLGAETWTDNQANATTSVKLWRNGDYIIANATTTFTGAASGTIELTIPAAYTPDSNIYTVTYVEDVGHVTAIDNNTVTSNKGTAYFNASLNTLAYSTTNSAGTYATLGGSSATVPHTWASPDVLKWYVTWKVANWQPSASLSANEIMVQTVRAKANGDAASATSGNPIIAPTSVYDTNGAYSVSTGLFTAPKKGCYRIHGFIISATAAIALSSEVDGTGVSNIGITDASGEGIFDGIECVNKDQTISISPGGTLDVTSITLYFDQVPDFTVFSAITPVISKWTSYTPTVSQSDNNTEVGLWRRVGEDMEIKINIAWTGNAGAFSTFDVDLPSGYTVDTAKLANSTASQEIVGEGTFFDSAGGTTRYHIMLTYQDSNSLRVKYGATTGAINHWTDITNAAPASVTSGDYLNFKATIPISGW